SWRVTENFTTPAFGTGPCCCCAFPTRIPARNVAAILLIHFSRPPEGVSPSRQNLNLIVACTLRIGFAVEGRPNWGLVAITFQLGYVTWFRAFSVSSRKSKLSRSENRNVLAIEAFKANCPGPVIEFRPAFPQYPDRGAATAAGFRNRPGSWA